MDSLNKSLTTLIDGQICFSSMVLGFINMLTGEGAEIHKTMKNTGCGLSLSLSECQASFSIFQKRHRSINQITEGETEHSSVHLLLIETALK